MSTIITIQKVQDSFLPVKEKDNDPNLPLAQLLYLASMNEKNNNKPFTENHLNIFQNCHRWERITTYSLRSLLVVNTALLVGAAFNTLIPLAPANNTTESGSGLTTGQSGLIALTALVGTFTNAFSFWATGFAPDYSSNAANKMQDAFAELKDIYNNLAGRLLILYFSDRQDEAVTIANNINIKLLKGRSLSYIGSKEKTKQLVSRLKESVSYIKGNEKILPSTADLLTIILIRKLR